jgi:peptidoglycan/LPS O-acetylase OafA/YrhL
MTTLAPPRDDASAVTDRAHISRVPYLPGLDGMRALAVVAVMVYHANSDWLSGGFLGVEMFFVISGYLITLLLISERERNYRISLRHFWMRRARRLLPALYVMMAAVVAWTATFERDALGALRGDVIAGLFYVSNWYQIFTGLGYTAAGDFAPLRHLWSLAVEEQFYLLWPLVMIVLLGRSGTRRVADVSRWLFLGAIAVTVIVALLYYPGPIADPSVTPDAYWWIGDRPIAKIDALYLSTATRLSGLMLGSAFAMVWRPLAVVRGPLRSKGRLFDVGALAAFVFIGWLCWTTYLATPAGADPFLFRGGFLLVDLATVAIIAAVTHRGAATNRLLGNAVFLWIGTRSYGLYLYHWPIYQMIRGVAGNKLNIGEFVFAMLLTGAITEISYRCVERPIRSGRFGVWWGRIRARPQRGPKVVFAGATAVVVAVTVGLGATLLAAPLRQNEIAEALDQGEEFTTDLLEVDEVPEATVDTSDEATDDADGESGSTPNGTGPTGTDADGTGPDGTGQSASTDDRDRNGSSAMVPDTSAPDPTASSPPGTAALVDPSVTTTPPTTAPPTTVAPTTTAAPAPTPGIVTTLDGITPLDVPASTTGFPLVALGDSVMLGAAEELQARGFQVDAVQSRQMNSFVPTMATLRDNGVFGSVVVVHLGTNGPFSQETLDSMLSTVANVPVVLLVTAKADRGWVADNNARLRNVPATHPNVTVVDWEAISATCPDRCFYDDGIHLTQSGQNFYADMVGKVLGQI